jgi:hypothetical protein
MLTTKPFCATLLGLALATFTACDDGGGSGGSGGGTSNSTGSSQSTNSSSGSGNTSSTSSGSKLCTKSMPCSTPGEYCLFDFNDCAADAAGTCGNIIQCDGPQSGPACGCDGKVVEAEYGDCTLQSMSQPVADPSLCQTGTFACGQLMCKRNAEVCQETSGGPAPGTDTFQCVALKDTQNTCSNGIPDCGCLMTGGGGATCSSDADHQETVHILAP